jgi:hypothetical protein
MKVPVRKDRIIPERRPGATWRRFRPLVVASLVLAGLLFPMTEGAVACVTSHGRPFLSGLNNWPAAGSPFYSAVEGQQAPVVIRVTPGHCVPQSGSTAAFGTQNALAVAGQDYTPRSGTTPLLCSDVDGEIQEQVFCPPGYFDQHPVPVQTTGGDGEDAAAVEPLNFVLSNGQPFGLAEPGSAPIHIIDADGPTRVSLEPTLAGGPVPYQRTEFGSILIPVFGAGSGSPGPVGYTVEPDPARPATPGEDFTVASPNPLPINGSTRLGFIQIDMVGDKLGEGDESVIITLQPGAGYTVAEPSSTTFTIIDNEESVFPKSRFHHPRNKWKYNKADYRIREFHIFATDEGGSGVVAGELALRRNLANGKCAWKTKSGWQKKDCQNREWLPTKYDDVGELFYYRMKQLKSSVGTKIKDYTAFARAIDGAGNVEKEFNKKRNMNTFEIKRRGKTQKS